MKKLSTLAALCLVLFACTNNKTEEIAEDVCGCFEPVTEDISSTTKKLLVRVSKADNPTKAMQTEMKKIDEEDQADVVREIQALSTMRGNSKVEKCMNKLESKYKDFKIEGDDKKKLGEIADEMSDVDNCEAAAALLKIFSNAGNEDDSRDRNDEQNEE